VGFAVYGVKLHLLCSTNRVPLSYELTPASTADVLLVEELLEEARLGGGTARRLFRGPRLPLRAAAGGTRAARRPALGAERAQRRPAIRQQAEVCFATLKRTFGMEGTLASTLVGLASRIAAKICAHAYGLYVNRLLWADRRGASRSFGPEILATLI
jgi:hypothetical protein